MSVILNVVLSLTISNHVFVLQYGQINDIKLGAITYDVRIVKNVLRIKGYFLMLIFMQFVLMLI